MSNNLFRKGLVAAAITGLAATAFAGTPAFAAAGVTLAPTTGTGYTVLSGNSFSLTETASSEVPSSSYNTLEFVVTNVDGVAATATVSGTNANHAAAAHNQVALSGAAGSVTAAHALQYTGTTVPGSTDVTTYYNNNTITLAGVASTSTAHYIVSAFLDANGNGLADAGELVGTQTVTFLKAADVTATTTISAPIYTSATTVNATTVVTNAGWNTAQATAPSIAFTDGQSHTLVSASATTYSADNANYGYATAKTVAYDFDSVTAGTQNALPKGTIVSAQASLGGTAIGAAATATVVDSDVATLTGSVVVSKTSNGTDVALNGAFQAKVVAKDASATPVVLAGKTVTAAVTVSATNFLATKALYDAAVAAHALNASSAAPATVTINGVTYTNVAALPGAGSGSTAVAKLSGVTDANGEVVYNVSSTGLADGDDIAFAFASANATGSVSANEAAASYTARITNLNSTHQVAVLAGGSASVVVTVTDQFGNAIADTSDLRVRLTSATPVTNTATSVAATQANAVIVPIVGGTATATVADNGTGTGRVNTYTVEYIKRDAALGGYGSNTATSIATDFAVSVVSAADLTAGVVALSGTGVNPVLDASSTAIVGQYKATVGSLSTATHTAYDGRNPLTAAPAAYITALGAGQAITATVSSSTTPSYVGTSVAGQAVTFALAGAAFKAALPGGDVYAVDSITVPASASGVASVTVYSNISGDQTVKVTAGAVTSTLLATFPAPAADKGAAIKIDAPATALPGTTIKVVATVVDKFGNTVSTVSGSSSATATLFSLAITGIGSGSAQSTYDATVAANRVDLTNGTVTKYVVLGASDTGSLTITATYDVDGTTATNAAVTKVATVVVGAPKAAKTAIAVGADQAQTGAAVDVIATATDAAGKAAAGVVVTFDNVGQGYLSSTTATTDANGVAKVKLVGNVAGRNTLTATANGATAATAGVSFGAADANITVKGKRVTVTYEYAGLAKVVVSVNGTRKPAVYPADDNEGTFSFNLKAGTNKIAVSIAGKTVDSKTVKIKK